MELQTITAGYQYTRVFLFKSLTCYFVLALALYAAVTVTLDRINNS